MKKSKKSVLLLYIFLLLNFSIVAQTEELNCLKDYNTFIKKKIKQQNCKYNSIQDSLKFIIKFEINENGNFISIEIVKSNFKKYNIDEEKVLKKLKKYKIPCLYNTYYSEKEKPDKVILVFNNELVN